MIYINIYINISFLLTQNMLSSSKQFFITKRKKSEQKSTCTKTLHHLWLLSWIFGADLGWLVAIFDSATYLSFKNISLWWILHCKKYSYTFSIRIKAKKLKDSNIYMHKIFSIMSRVDFGGHFEKSAPTRLSHNIKSANKQKSKP